MFFPNSFLMPHSTLHVLLQYPYVLSQCSFYSISVLMLCSLLYVLLKHRTYVLFHRYGVPNTTVRGPRSCPCLTTGPSTSTTVHLCDVITIVTSSSYSSSDLSSKQKKMVVSLKRHIWVFLFTHCFVVCVKFKEKNVQTLKESFLC